jgi:hypothetical protein
MTIELQEPQVRRDLPPARLYLDDIEQIVRIFSQEIKAYERELNPGEQQREPEPTFQIRDRVTHDINDLQKIAKVTNTLSITIESNRSYVSLALFISNAGVSWGEYGLTKADAWKTYHKLEALFKPRSHWLRAWPHRSASTTIATVLGTALIIAIPIAFTVRAVAHEFARNHALGVAALILFTTLGMSLLLTAPLLAWPCTVVLRQLPEIAEAREERNSKLFFAALGWALGTATALVGIYVKHKFWP